MPQLMHDSAKPRVFLPHKGVVLTGKGRRGGDALFLS